MTTRMNLQDIKDEVAKEYTYNFTGTERDWDEMINHDFEYGIGLSKVYSEVELMEEVARRYATEVANTTLERAAIKAKELTPLGFNQEGIYKSILETPIELL